MFITAAAVSLALLTAPQEPTSHQQAMTCTGVFLFATVLMADLAENEPTSENEANLELSSKLLSAADNDRIAAAAREGISADQSGEILTQWVEANLEAQGDAIGRDLEGCLTLYGDAVM